MFGAIRNRTGPARRTCPASASVSDVGEWTQRPPSGSAGEVGRLHLAEALTYRIDTTRQLRAA